MGQMEGLSTEVLRMILRALPDIASLESAALSCPALYLAFKDDMASIGSSVLREQIDSRLLPDAMASSESWALRQRLRHADVATVTREVRRFMAQYIEQTPEPPRTWPFPSARRMAIHYVRLSQQAAESSDPHSKASSPVTGDTIVVSPDKVYLAHRAIYQLLTHRNLFDPFVPNQSDDYEELSDLTAARIDVSSIWREPGDETFEVPDLSSEALQLLAKLQTTMAQYDDGVRTSDFE
jgi:hypothetical protein